MKTTGTEPAGNFKAEKGGVSLSLRKNPESFKGSYSLGCRFPTPDEPKGSSSGVGGSYSKAALIALRDFLNETPLETLEG